MKVIIVGGVAGGASAAARLRRLDENAQIIVLEKGEYISYANCGLPYYIGGEITDKSALTLQTPESFYSRFRIDVRTLQEAISIDKENKTISIKKHKDGSVYSESYDKLILSPGATPVKPPLQGIDDSRIFTLRTIPDTYEIKNYIDENKPKTAVVVGGGYIGVEMAENLSKRGIEVTIIEMAPHLIGPLDEDTACDVHHYIRSKGINIMLNTMVKAFVPKENTIGVELEKGIIETDMVLMSVGVRPDNSLLKDSGIATSEKGSILVDENQLTSDKDIYAVGDAIQIVNFVTGQPDFIPLAGPANKQGRIAANHICGIDSKYAGTLGSAVLKLFDMTVATTGINEKTAKAKGLNYDKVFLYSASHATYYPGATNMSIKVIFEKGTGKILGAQIVGFEGVEKRVDVLATAIRAGMTAFDLTELELCYAPPFSSAKDPVNMAGFIIENILTGKVEQYYWQDVPCLIKAEGVTLLDTRTGGEYRRGHIENAINIPLDKLRENLSSLDKSKPVFVNCQSGLRSYIACRILSQKGFKCYNLAGGYRLYESVMSDIPFDSDTVHPCGVKV